METKTQYQVMHQDGSVPVKHWTRGVPVEDAALRQVSNVAKMPFIHKWVAVMPDVHVGVGATVGSVIPTKGAVIPDQGGVSEAEVPEDESLPPKANGRAALHLLHRQFMGKGDGAPGLSSVMVDAFNIIQDRIARARLAGDPPDVTIAPRLGDIGLFEFHRASEAVPLGQEATEREIEEIERAVYALAA